MSYVYTIYHVDGPSRMQDSPLLDNGIILVFKEKLDAEKYILDNNLVPYCFTVKVKLR